MPDRSDGFYASDDFDILNRVTAIRENGAISGISVLARYAYDPMGRRSDVSFGNGTSRNYAYDTAGRPIGVKIDLAGTAGDLTIGAVAGSGSPITRNPAGQITSIMRDNYSYAWTAHSTSSATARPTVSISTTTKPQSSLNHNLKSVPLVLPGYNHQWEQPNSKLTTSAKLCGFSA